MPGHYELGAPVVSIEMPDAVSVNVVADDPGMPAVAWITSDEVFVARLDLTLGELTDPMGVSGSVEPIAHPIERPAIVVAADEGLVVAFTSHQGGGGSVFQVLVSDGSATEPSLISGQAKPETNLVHGTADGNGGYVLTWLENSTLSVAREAGGTVVEREMVDELTCDCCNIAPVFMDGQGIVVAYRDLENTEEGVVRNVVAVRSDDGGESFGTVVPIADEDWFIDGCPFNGPSAIELSGELVVAWMDARQTVHPEQASSTIWVDRSKDGGTTFGTDLAVATDAIHRWPVMAVDARQVIHMVWETQGPDGGLSYAASLDAGLTFGDPRLLLQAERGQPKAPSIAHQDGFLIVTWTDADGGHLTVWPLEADD